MRLNAAFSRTWAIVAGVLTALAGAGHDALASVVGEWGAGAIVLLGLVVVASSRAITEPAAPTRQALFHDPDSSTNPLK